MNYELSGVIVCLILFMFFQAWYFRGWERQERDRYSEQIGKLEFVQKEERELWTKERQQLLDRIQAPSFAEYKTQEIRLEKVKNGVQEPPKLEQL